MVLSRKEIDDWPVSWPEPGGGLDGAEPARQLRRRLRRHGLWDQSQIAGRHWPIGCVALEVTQRCNLDCTLCYLSDHSEAVIDLPLGEIFRRIDAIRALYGPGTAVQITGGDPTLRSRDDLIRIVERIARSGMTPALFTNGIRATRGLLRALATAGLADVAFHVDMTQERKGYSSEQQLNAVRRDYMERARGLGLSVMFNTTVFRDNYAEIPLVARLFRDHADIVDMASFQLQADTGRGVLRGRDEIITRAGVTGKIGDGLGRALNFNAITLGHPDCNRYATCLVAGGTVHDLLDDANFIQDLFARTAGHSFDRHSRRRALADIVKVGLVHPGLIGRGLGYLATKAWAMAGDLWRARGRVHKLSFFVHNFMDAGQLERDRCEACIYMVATADGPVSMCLHNARRDSFILKPVSIGDGGNGALWDPLTGARMAADRPANVARLASHRTPVLPFKRLKGRARRAAREEHLLNVKDRADREAL